LTGGNGNEKSVAEVIGQDKPGQLDEALGKLPPRWKN